MRTDLVVPAELKHRGLNDWGAEYTQSFLSKCATSPAFRVLSSPTSRRGFACIDLVLCYLAEDGGDGSYKFVTEMWFNCDELPQICGCSMGLAGKRARAPLL